MRKLRHLIGLCVIFVALLAVRAASAYELQTSFDVPRLLCTLPRGLLLSCLHGGGSYAVDKTRTITVTAIDTGRRGP